jgi:hypothetical protein
MVANTNNSPKGAGFFGFFCFVFFTSILPVDCLVELMWKSLQHSTFA